MNQPTRLFVAALCFVLVASIAWGTPGLTSAAAPLPAVTPTVDPASVYLLRVYEQLEIMGSAFDALADLSESPRFGTDAWESQAIINLSAIQAADKELSAIKPPTHLAASHSVLLAATARCVAATNSFANGYDNQDAALFNMAKEQGQSCSKGIAAYFEMLAAPISGATPTPTAPPAADSVIATRDANLRAGPGTTYKVIGTVKAGQQLKVIGRNPKGDWLQLDGGRWIAAFLVKPAAPATATPAPMMTPTPEPSDAWYQGGTLQNAKIAEWKAATEQNKLATAADWVTTELKIPVSSPDELKPYALKLLECIDGMVDISPPTNPNPVSVFLGLCANAAVAPPTATPEPGLPADVEAKNAGDWAKMNDAQRDQLARYSLEFWKKNVRGVSLTADEMALCITEEVIKPGTPLTMMIMAIASRCVQNSQ